MDSGKTIYHFQPNRGNLVTGILNTKGFIEDKLGINIKLWDSRAVEKKVNNVLRIRKR
ncbi:MAG: hypothetical protein NT074_00880 [Methanomicrobiales archaeon]|nr:hypothetical protein [Methanomicrobiales archaeon]